ncbi:unnamed protein product [Caenorhabditis sp. 36 PRJEB53466]|nr:unnamed protein product [Caenorhabditis sp. 36 PRJEB53466]
MIPHRSALFNNDDSAAPSNKSRMFCVSYASSQQQQSANTPTIHEQQEEIYSSLKKVRTADDLTSSQLSIDKHITMIPLGSPHELQRETTANGTMIRVTSGLPQKIEMTPNEKLRELVPKMRLEHSHQPRPEQPRKVDLQEPREEVSLKKLKVRGSSRGQQQQKKKKKEHVDSAENTNTRSNLPPFCPLSALSARPPSCSDPGKNVALALAQYFEGWSGRAMEGRVSGGQVRGTNNIRGYWERNIQIEQRQRAEEERRQRPRSYGFPKWRSTDALSASLVASNNIQIPLDSRIPEERLRKMEETEREAIEVKKEIHEEAEMVAGSSTRKLSKGKSLDSLNMQVDYRPWYDTEKIKSAVSRESIANIATSREFFETASTRDWRSAANSRRDSMCSVSMAPPLPPKSDAIQLRQASVNQPARPPVHHHNGYGHHYPPTPSSASVSVSNGTQNVNVLTISSGYDGAQVAQKPQQLPTQTSINRLIQQDSPQTADPIEQQEVLLMLYLKQNLDIVQGLGIHIPQELLAEMEDLQMLPVELRLCDEEPHRMFSPVAKNGRYQRKPQVNMAPNRQLIGQKYVNKREVPISRSRQNSEMTNSNVDLSYYHHPSSSYGYH